MRLNKILHSDDGDGGGDDDDKLREESFDYRMNSALLYIFNRKLSEYVIMFNHGRLITIAQVQCFSCVSVFQ